MLKKLILPAIVLIFVAGSSGTAFYFYSKYQEAKAALENPQQIAQEETDRILNKLSQIMVLPDEQPSIATVLDKDSLADQPFFAHAENGDKVIIYAEARKAILYRMEANKIIEFAPVEITPNEAGLEQQAMDAEEAPTDETQAVEETPTDEAPAEEPAQ